MKSYSEVLGILDRLVEGHPAITQYQRDLAACHMGMTWPLRSLGRRKEAEQSFETARKIAARLVRLNPNVTQFQSTLAWCYGEYGLFLNDLHRWDESLSKIGEALEIVERLAEANPGEMTHQMVLAQGHMNIGHVRQAAGRFEEAAGSFETARKVLKPLLDKQGDNSDLRHLMGVIRNDLGRSLYELKRFEAAREHIEEATRHERVALDREPQSMLYRRSLDEQYRNLVIVYRNLGCPEKLAAVARERQALWPGNGAQIFDSALALATCIPLVRRGKVGMTAAGRAECGKYEDEALSVLRAAVQAGFLDVRRVREEPRLEPLRSRDEFRLLVLEMMDRAMPGDPFQR